MSPTTSVRARLLLLVASLVLTLGGAAGWLAWTVAGQQQRIARILDYQQRADAIHAVSRAVSAFRYTLGQLNSAMLLGADVAQLAQARNDVAQALQQLEQSARNLARMDPHVSDTVLTHARDLPQRTEGSMRAMLAGDLEQARADAASVRRSLAVIEATLSAAVERENAAYTEAMTAEQQRLAQERKAALAVVLVAAAAGLGSALWLLAGITGPLRRIAEALRRLNAGASDVDMPPVTGDEFGEVAVALRQFRERADRLRELAYRDPQTGLGNRALLEEALQQALSRDPPRPLALLHLNLDHLRRINDSMGQRAGDHVIAEVAARITGTLHWRPWSAASAATASASCSRRASRKRRRRLRGRRRRTCCG